MKRNTYFTLIALFILSACQPSPSGHEQAATAELSLTKPNANIPAPVPMPSEIGTITLKDYPVNQDNFFVDPRTNEQKMHLVESWAPEDVDKEIALYNAEFARMKIDPKYIRYQVSIVDGKSWVLYPKDIRTNEAYIVSIKGVIRPSIDLFGLLDKSTNDDFFNLVKVNIPNAQAVGDKSGWHVFAEIQDGRVTQWYDATKDKINTVEAKPESVQTPEAPQKDEIKIINTLNLEDGPEFNRLSRVDLEDLTSGKLAEIERQWLEENPFSEDIKPLSKISIIEEKYDNLHFYKVDHKVVRLFFPFEYHEKSSRPYKVISYYVLEDKDLFNSLEYNDKDHPGIKKLGIKSWAWLNPDGSTVIAHQLINLVVGDLLDGEDFFDYPGVDFYNFEEHQSPRDGIHIIEFNMQIYELYPELKPLELAKKWVSTKNMPKEMETKLLGWSHISQVWE